MNIRDLDLNLLVFLDALLKTRNVSRAAEQLGITQPAMSNALNRLRKQFDDPLLLRTSKGMEPTEKALQLMTPIHQSLAQLSQALSPSEPFDPKSSRRVFTLAGSDYVDHLIYPNVIKRLEQEAPHTSVDSVRLSDTSFNALERGEIDAIIHSFDEPISDACYQTKLFDDGFTGVVRAQHPCLNKLKNNKLSLASYLKYGHIMISKTGIGKGYADSYLTRQKKSRHTAITVRQSSIAPILIALESDLIATVPSKAALKFSKLLPIELVELPFVIPDFELSIVWGPLSQHNSAHQWFRKLLIDECKKLAIK